MAFTLIIKGDGQQAVAACTLKGVELLAAPVKHPRFNEATCVAADSTQWETLSRWFCETCPDHVFPPGSLLWYGPRVTPLVSDLR